MYRFIILLTLICVSLHGDPLEALFKIGGVKNAEQAQQAWRQQGDRWTFEERYENKRQEILNALTAMGWFEAKHATNTHYTYGVILGALQSSVQQRINYLVAEWNRGVRFDVIVFLTGHRPLHLTKEAAFSGTESTMMLQTWDETAMPQDLKQLPLILVHAPALPSRGRPTTESTLHTWMHSLPTPGSCLFFSNQPYVHYQDAIIENTLPSSFSTETVGQEGGETLPTSVLLDTVAKWLYWKAPYPAS